MNNFNQNIDEYLEQAATKLGGNLSKNRPGYPELLRTFEERRIDWTDNSINKAILIQPAFTSKGVDDSLWQFRIAAWYHIPPKSLKYSKSLIKNTSFNIIIRQLDELFENAINILDKIDLDELKKISTSISS